MSISYSYQTTIFSERFNRDWTVINQYLQEAEVSVTVPDGDTTFVIDEFGFADGAELQDSSMDYTLTDFGAVTENLGLGHPVMFSRVTHADGVSHVLKINRHVYEGPPEDRWMSGFDTIFILVAGDPLPALTTVSEVEDFLNSATWEAPDPAIYPAGGTLDWGDFDIEAPPPPPPEGTEDADTLVGTIDTDLLSGLGGDDLIQGLGGDDTLYGGTGHDTLEGGDAYDSLIGGTGDDSLDGGFANDTLYGGEGNDTLAGGEMEDALFGEAGDDVLRGGLGNWDEVLDGGDGLDTVDYSDITFPQGVAVDLAAGTGGGNFYTGNDTLVSIENVIGFDGNDTLLGDDGANFMRGLDGADRLDGRDGIDWLDGGAGADTLTGGLGEDMMIGGAGNDLFIIGAGDTLAEYAGDGTDTVQSTLSHTLGANLEHLILTGTAAINGTGNALGNRITGNAGANVLNGTSGADTLIGGAGHDTYVTDGGDTITEGAGAGTDTVQSRVTHALGTNLEHLVLTGTAAVNGTGNGLANRLTGNAGANSLNGGAGADTLTGGAGRDLLAGGADSVRDVFVFAATTDSRKGATTRDVISNFKSGFDDIDLSGIDAHTTKSGNQAFVFGGTTAKAHGVWVVDTGANVSVFADVNGDKLADLEVQVNALSKLVAGDFIL